VDTRDEGHVGIGGPAGVHYIASLDGLRALAVLAVMAYHGGVPFLGGGFLGVDAFFVLSGFLITTLLTREFASRGTIHLGQFWFRRARRLLPALLLVLVFVGVVAYIGDTPGFNAGLRPDALFTLLYSSNWHFIAAGANYFTATGPVSPLTHTWSLAIEEQFYLVWPLVLLATLSAFRANLRRGLWVLFAITVAGSLGSAVEMAVLYTGTNDTRLYYGTDTHAQSILTGAALAVVLAIVTEKRSSTGSTPTGRLAHRSTGEPAWLATSRPLRTGLTAVGTLGACATAYLWTKATGDQWMLYHGGFLLASVAVAAVLLLVVSGQDPLLGRFLSQPALVFVGRISYGLYLWHFPLFLWLDHANTGLSGWNLVAFRMAVSFVVATASYHLVEAPIRRHAISMGWRALVATPTAVALAAAAIYAGTLPTVGGAALASTVHRSDAPTRSARASDLTRPNVLLLGDSLAETLGDGWSGPVANFYGLNLVNLGTPNCSLAIGVFRVMNFPPRFSAPPCQPFSGDPGWPTDWTSDVAAYGPKVSIVLNRLDVVDRLYNGTWTHVGDPAFDAYLESQMRLAISILSARGGKVVFLTTPFFDTGEQPNGLPWPEDDPVRVILYNQLIRQAVAASGSAASVIDLNAIADPEGQYQSVVDGETIRFTDGIHWTFQGDCWLAPQILPEIARVAASGTGSPVHAVPGPADVMTLPQSLCPNVG
jgi:peptidoglycan/LPS O-acetylase OafA/YrhL